jgi:hypothetical protein
MDSSAWGDFGPIQKVAEVYPGSGRRWHMSGHAPIQPDISSPGSEIWMHESQPWIEIARRIGAGACQRLIPTAAL